MAVIANKLKSRRATAILTSLLLGFGSLTALTAIQVAAPQKADAAITVDMAGQTLQFRANLANCLSGCPSSTQTSFAITAITYSAGTITYTASNAAVSALAQYQGIVISGTASQTAACTEAFGPKQITVKGTTTFGVTQTITGSCSTSAATGSYYPAVNGAANGSKVLYTYVGLINGVAIDAVVTTTLDANVTTTFDPATSANANAATDYTNDGYFYQTLGGSGTVAGQGASFRFDFYLHDSVAVSGGVVSGTALTLQNISVTSIDIDNSNQYSDFSGFQNYKLSSSSSSVTAIAARSPGNGSITSATSSGSGGSRAYVFTINNSYAVGDIITVSGATPSGYNGTYTVASRNSTTFTTTTGRASVTGTWSGTATATGVSIVTYTAVNSFAAGDTVTITNATTPAFNGTYAIYSQTGSSFTVLSAATGSTSTAAASVDASNLKWTASPTSPRLLATNPKTVRFQSCSTCTNLANDDRDAVETLFTSVTSVTVKVGQTDTAKLQGAYGVLFGPRIWTAGSKLNPNTFNTPPTSANTSTSVPANTNTFLTSDNLGSTGFSDVDGNPFSGVKITALPGSGTLEWNNGTGWQSVAVDQVITAADIEGSKVRFNGNANTTILFKVFDGLDYSATAYTLSLTVSGEGQTISATNPGGQHPSTEIDISATATSGLQVVASRSVASTSVCTVSANLHITFLAVGSCELTFNQSGGTTGGHTYSQAAPVSFTIVVTNLAVQNITFPDPGNQVVTSFPTISTIASNAVSKDVSNNATGLPVNLASFTPAVCTINVNGTSIDLLKLGQCEITASQGGGTSGGITYAAASSVPQKFQITNPLPRPAAPTGSGASSSSITIVFTPNVSAAKHICKVYNAAGAIVKTIDPCTNGQTISNLSTDGPFKVSITAVGDGTTNSDSLEGPLSDAISTLSPSLSPTPQTVSGTKGTAITDTTAYTPTNFTTSPTYVISGGTLPSGLSFSGSTGVISGTPTSTLASTVFTVTAGNGTETATASITISVASPAFTVTFDSNGGSVVSPSSTSWTSGTSLFLPAGPNLQGYSFSGWYDARSGGNLVGSGSTSVSPSNTSRFTLYAHWNAISNSIIYISGGATGSAPVTPTTVLSGDTFTAPANTYNYPGHTFSGWSDGSSTYLAGDTYPSSGSITGNVTLTATWTLNTVTIFFDPNSAAGGSGTMANQTVSYDSSTALDNQATSTFTNTGKNFIGWNTNPSATTAQYVDGASVRLTTDTTLYAIWSSFLLWIIDPADQNYLQGGTIPDLLTDIQVTPTAGLASGESITCGVYTTSDVLHTSPLTIDASLAIGTYVIWCSGPAAAGYGDPSVNTGVLTVDSPNRSITYLGNLNSGGSAPSSTVVTTGSIATVSNEATLVRTSFGFNGWNTLADGSGISFAPGDTTTLALNIVLYAQWEQDSYHGIAKSDLLTLGTSTTSTDIGIDTTWTNGQSSVRAQIPANSFPNNTTLRYYVVNTLRYANSILGASNHYVLDLLLTWLASDFTVPDADLTKPIRVTISNDNIRANAAIYVIVGRTHTLLSSDASTLAAAGARVVSVVDGQAILEVIRDPQLVVKNQTYTVTYADSFKDSGSVPVDSNTYLGNETATVLGNSGNLLRAGYQFSGWCDVTVNLGASCGGHSFQNGIQLPLANANIVLHAIWIANSLAITYDANSGDAPVGGSTTTTTGANVSSLATTSRSGYSFNGWFTDRFIGTQISTTSPHGKTADFTLYAQWTPLGSSSVVFNSNYGTGVMATQTSNVPQSIHANAFTREGFTFLQWNSSATETGTVFADGATYDFTTGITLYAIWSANSLLITYDANGGDTPVNGETSTVTAGTISSLATSNLSGYTLAGWFTELAGGAQITTSSPHGQTSNFTLYAHWNVVSSGGGSGGGNVDPAPVAPTPPVVPEPAPVAPTPPVVPEPTPEIPIFITPGNVEPAAPIKQPTVVTPLTIPTSPISKVIAPTNIGVPEVIAFPSEPLSIREVAVYPSKVNNGIEISGNKWSIAISSTTQLVKATTVEGSNHIAIEAGNTVTTFGTGFKPNSQVDVFVYSTSIWLGSAITDANGNYSVTLPMPKALEAGEHTFQAVGTTFDNVSRTANVPITLLAATTKKASKKLNIFFAMNSISLDKTAKAQITALYNSVKSRLTSASNVSIDIVGWVQPTLVSPNVNYLSSGRALVVMKFFKSLGSKANFTLNTPGHDKLNIPTSRRAAITVTWTNPKS